MKDGITQLLLLALYILPTARCAVATNPRTLPIEEATIRELQTEIRSGRLQCRELVQHYLRRIDAYDKSGPALNAIVVVNTMALEEAAELDVSAARGEYAGPLHCVALIVKDNFETIGLPATAGSLSMEGWISSKDAFQVRRMREAGAIILAKSNMAEFAFSPYETVSSILPGYTRNPYALNRVTAGSSGGTAAAVAASFGAVGLGTDTGNSIRGPASHQALVGIRSTMGLTSRAGVAPLNLSADIAGPLARTVEDAVAVLQVIAGHDRDDPVTLAASERVIPDYHEALIATGLEGARIGILTQAYSTPTTDREIEQRFAEAVEDLRRSGASVSHVEISRLDELRRIPTGGCNPFKRDLEDYLRSRTPPPPVTSLEEILGSRKFHPSIEKRLESGHAAEDAPDESAGCRSREEFRARLREAVLALMESERLDALIYPTWSNPPRLIGDLTTPHGDNNQLFAPATGFPAITVPMGSTRNETLPAGLQFFGRPWDESTLIRLAYAYEQATRHRRPPPSTPPLARSRLQGR
ncbi:MAG TPA: amidase family protein [Thermoanaerobaculia bacterium]|nr:amidase family protein [Thermoanaerobaculia bacterium]